MLKKNGTAGLAHEHILLIVSFFIMVVAYGTQGSFGVFFKPMLNDFGWTREATSGPYSLYMIMSGLLGIVAGRLSDKFGPRRVAAISGVFLGLGFLLMSRIDSLWQLLLSYGVLVAAGTSGIFVPLVSTITRWFIKRRGFMTGIAAAGVGVGTAIVPPVASQLTVSFGWRTSLLVMAVFALVSIVLLAQFVRGEPDNAGASGSRDAIADEKFSIGLMARSRQFWMLCAAWFCYGFFFQTGLVHIVPHATDVGMSPVAASTIFTAIGLLSAVGRPVLGLAGDRFGNKSTIITSFVLISIAFLGLIASSAVWMLYLFAVVYGFFLGVGILLPPLIAEYFGLKALGTIMGIIFMATSLGGAAGPIAAGRIFDATGNYSLAFLLCAVSGFIALAFVSLVKRTPR